MNKVQPIPGLFILFTDPSFANATEQKTSLSYYNFVVIESIGGGKKRLHRSEKLV
jgi:hypothetical protein